MFVRFREALTFDRLGLGLLGALAGAVFGVLTQAVLGLNYLPDGTRRFPVEGATLGGVGFFICGFVAGTAEIRGKAGRLVAGVVVGTGAGTVLGALVGSALPAMEQKDFAIDVGIGTVIGAIIGCVLGGLVGFIRNGTTHVTPPPV